MASKFERELEAMAERAKRQENITKLNAMISECEGLLAVVPGIPGASLEEIQERNFLILRRAWLYEMRADEQRIFDEAGVDSATAEEIASKLK